MYIKPKYVNMILMMPLMMAILSVVFCLTSISFIYSLTMLLVFFVAIIYIIDLASFVSVLFKGRFDSFIARIPPVNLWSWVSSLLIVALFFMSHRSLFSSSGEFGKVLILIVSLGVVFTFLVKTYKKFVFEKKINDDFEDEGF